MKTKPYDTRRKFWACLECKYIEETSWAAVSMTHCHTAAFRVLLVPYAAKADAVAKAPNSIPWQGEAARPYRSRK